MGQSSRRAREPQRFLRRTRAKLDHTNEVILTYGNSIIGVLLIFLDSCSDSNNNADDAPEQEQVRFEVIEI